MPVVGFNPQFNSCMACGACCALYRVSFYWAEADAVAGGSVPVELTERVSAHTSAMKGTANSRPRCIALGGTIGENVFCTIYAQRPSACRDFKVAWENGLPNEYCDKARVAWAMPILPPFPPANPDQPTTPKAA